MIPVMCRVTHDPARNLYGDCLRACVASIMELDAELVPHFADHGVNADQAWRDCRKWLGLRGFTVFVCNYPGLPLNELLEHIGEINPDVHYLLFGSTGEADHVVVGCGGKIVHNPSWHGGSLRGPLTAHDGVPLWSVWVIARR